MSEETINRELTVTSNNSNSEIMRINCQSSPTLKFVKVWYQRENLIKRFIENSKAYTVTTVKK